MIREARLFILGLVLLTGCADDLLLHPSTQPVSFGSAQPRTIHLGSRTVEVFVARSPGAMSAAPRAYVLEFTGNATRAEYVVNELATGWGDRPVEVWVMNYPGFGASTGPATLHAIPSAALATYDAVASEAHGRPIIVCGGSLGTTVALYVPTKRPVAAIILQNPPPLERMLLQKHGWVLPAPVVAQIPAELNSLANAPHVKAPAVFVLAGKDTNVPPQYQQMVVEAYAGEKHLVRMPDANHSTPIEGEALQRFQAELDWIWSLVAK